MQLKKNENIYFKAYLHLSILVILIFSIFAFTDIFILLFYNTEGQTWIPYQGIRSTIGLCDLRSNSGKIPKPNYTDNTQFRTARISLCLPMKT